MKTKVLGWKQHGELPDSESKLAALLKPGVHNLHGDADAGKTAMVAALTVALAAGRAGAPDGFFGQALGGAAGVAVIPDQRHAARMGTILEAAAFARGIAAPLPFAIAAHQPGGVGPTVVTTHRLIDLRDALAAPLRLVVLDEIDGDQTRARAAADNIASAMACAVLIVSRNPVGVSGVTLEIEGGALTYREPGGEGWRRAFAFERVALAGQEAPVVRAGKALGFTRMIGEATPPPLPVVRGDEPKIAEKFVVFGTGREITPAERAAWPDYIVARNATDAVPTLDTAPANGVRMVEIVPNDRDGRNENARRTEAHLRALADSRGVGRRVVTRISPRTIAA